MRKGKSNCRMNASRVERRKSHRRKWIYIRVWTDDQLKPLGFFATGKQIAARETPLGLYKGLGAVISGIVPKMAIRFASFERKCFFLYVSSVWVELML
jgi:hypothetical protein